MTTKTTKRSGKARASRYTDEQRAEFAAADDALMDRATAILADPESPVIAGIVAAAVTGGVSARILSYSLRNQALLWDQADEQGIALRDVDTYKGWSGRGRQVIRGSRGLRIIRPVGMEDSGGAETEPVDHGDEYIVTNGEDKPARRRFRFMAVFDVSQTEGVDDADAIGAEPTPLARTCAGCGADSGQCDPHSTCGPAPEANPADMLSRSLAAQLARAGYTIAPPDDDAPRVDHDARTVHPGADDTSEPALRLLADAVATLTTRDRTQAATPKVC